jgi:hypothetical protein
MKMYGKKLLAMILLLTGFVSLFGMGTRVEAATVQNVKITYDGQVVDTFNGVPAKYITGTGNSNSGTYSCAGYVNAYFKTNYGINVHNLLSNQTPLVSETGYSFKEITSNIMPGDIVRMPGHWAIVKEVNNSNLTLIEQNWKWAQNGATYTKINRVISKDDSGVAVFRLYKGNQSMNKGCGLESVNETGYSTAEVESILFDHKTYADIYPDLKNSFGYNREALLQHYKTFGIREGRIASVFFDPAFYMKTNADVAKAYGATNWEAAYSHFVNFGFKEGRQGSLYFHSVNYLNRYEDLKKAFDNNYLEAAKHFLTHGIHEKRQASSQFSIAAYDKYNRDVAAAYSNPMDRIVHYIVYVALGNESRRCA